MRIGIDYRILTVGPSAATRGMPRYTQQQLREVLALGTDDEFLLFCDSRTDRSLILPEIRTAPNVEVRLVPDAVTVDYHDDRTMLAKAEVFESWLAAQRVDLYHATTPFFLDQLIVASHDACPYVATVYDLIPLIYPSQYLASAKLRQLYLLAGAMVSRATRLLAISEAARRDASRYLGFPEDRIDVASPIAEPFFRPMPGPAVDAALAGLRTRLGLRGQFVLSVADLHFTKNLETLLRGYALLPSGMRARLPLVVACHLSAEHERYLGDLAAKLGVGGQVLATGLVSDQELAALYNAARFVVHPSRFEGFGLPVLEAMQSGSPVIATTSSSLPEVAGDAAILVDPDDAPGFAGAMELLDEDDGRRDEMRARGLARAATYTGLALAEATLAGYARAVVPPDVPARPRIAMWTPLPPLPSGIAGYSAELVAALKPACEVDLFVDDDYLPSLDLLLAHRVRHFRAFDRLAATFDAVLYQLGASAFHLYMEEAMLCFSGVVVLHDLVWSHVVHHRWAEPGDIEGFRRRLRELEGDDAVAAYDAIDRSDHRLWAERLRAFLDGHLMLGEIVSASRAEIVHFPAAADELVARYPGARPTFVPMGVHVRASQPSAARARVGIAPTTFVVGVFGIVDDVKRVEASVSAFADVVADHPDSLLLVVGDALDPGYRNRLLALAAELGVGHAVRLTGYVDDAAFDDLLAASDVVVNLRFPSKKQMSATVLRAAAAGKPLVISDLPEWDFLPSTFCRRVPAGDPDEAVVLAAHLRELAAEPPLREERSAAARAYHQAEATPARMAAGYVAVLERILGRRLDGQPAAEISPVRRSTPTVNLNKVCEIEDFADPDLAMVMADVFSYKLAHLPAGYPKGSEYRKDWEIAMAVRALRDGGALRPDATILGVGAGSEDTSFYLTRHVGRVIATDRYLSAGTWSDVAPSAMLAYPATVAPYDFDASRLVVQHMDGRCLRFDDDTFDGIFSSGSIEHFGDFEDIAAAAYEMGRVLKPGGVLTVSTEILLSGPPGGKGMPGTVLFSPADLTRYVVEASGLELVDDLRLDVSLPTLASQRDLASAIRTRGGRSGEWPGDPGLDLPHLVMVSDGYVFGSVHLALRKGERYPVTPNAWAQPSAALRRAIEEDNRRTILGADDVDVAEAVVPAATAPAPREVVRPDSWDELESLSRRLLDEAGTRCDVVAGAVSQVLALHSHVDAIVGAVQAEAALAAECQVGIDVILSASATLPQALDDLAHDARWRDPVDAAVTRWDGHGTGWRWCPITLPNGTEFGVMVDPSLTDELTSAILAGGGPIDWTTVMLMLDRVEPGDVVVDLGACLGTFALAAAAVGCTVVAVEAAPLNAALLRASVARNGFTNVHVVNGAVGDAPGYVAFCADGPFGYVQGSVEDGSDVPGVVVRAITVDDVLDELDVGRVAMVKMDVEGSEIRAIRGMARLLGRHDAPLVLFESNGYTLAFYESRPEELLREMEGHGYRSYLIDPNRLYLVPPGQVQLQTVVDYLAVKGPIASTPAWHIEGPLPMEERISRMVRECEGSSPYVTGQRAFVAGALAYAEPEVLAHPAVVALLAELAPAGA